MTDPPFWNPPPIRAEIEYVPQPIPDEAFLWNGGPPTRLGYWWIRRTEARRTRKKMP